jgi:hypothetical protein
MVAFNITDMPAIDDPARVLDFDALRQSREHRTNEEGLGSLARVVRRLLVWLDGIQETSKKHESVYESQELEISKEVLDTWSDEDILDRIFQFGLVAEAIHDWADVMTQYSQQLDHWKRETGIWSDEAELIKTRLDRLAVVFTWNSAAMHGWINQLCGVYEQRNPDLEPLPAEPFDLGPTNAARLPRIL